MIFLLFLFDVNYDDDQQSKTTDVFVNRLIHYHKEENDTKHDESNDLSTNINRIRQRTIILFKNKINTRIEQRTAAATMASDVDDDYEDHKQDDIEVAIVISVVADVYNSDSDFGDDQSWADRVNPAPLNSLMLNTFPGLRHTVPIPAPSPVSEHNQDYSRLVREKAKELEKQIELFEKENGKVQSLCNERNLAIKKLKQEKRLFEQHRQQLRDHPDKCEREEIELLKNQVLTLQEDLKQRETLWSTTINRLKERIEPLAYENAEVKQEKDIIERKRLDLMEQLQTISK
ncbi:unnamed protein product [Rotaria sp. Silwood1]|nr:unnamed protein product [Rotaria sp. Silwood1]